MAGTAAHELNQPLTTVLASAELMTMTDDSNKLHQLAERIVENADRLARVTSKLVHIVSYQAKPYLSDDVILDLDKANPPLK